MSEKTKQVYAFIVEYHRAHSIAPSVREIADGVGLRSSASAQYYINVLIDSGLVTHLPGKMRTVVPCGRL